MSREHDKHPASTEWLPVYVCAHCRIDDGRPLLNLTQQARRRYGLEHQSVHPECRREIHRARRMPNHPKGETMATVTRYVLTYVPDSDPGARYLMDPPQGRYTYLTEERASRRLWRLREAGDLPKVYSASEIASMTVEAWACWPVHYDPCGTLRAIEGEPEAQS